MSTYVCTGNDVNRQQQEINKLRQRIVELEAGVYRGHQDEKLYEEQLQFELMISELSASLVNVDADQVDDKIQDGLKRISEFFNADRSAFLSASSENPAVKITHLYPVEATGVISTHVDISSLLPWSYQKLIRQEETIVLTTLDQLPRNAETDKKTWQRWGFRSVLLIPLVIAGSVRYLLGISSCYNECSWPPEYIPRLRLVGEIFANALQRMEIYQHLKEAEDKYRTLADATYDWVYWESPDGVFHYISPSCERITGYSVQEFLQAPELLTRIVAPQDRHIVEKHKHVLGSMTQGGLIHFRIRKKDGGMRWIEHLCRSVIGPAGEFLGTRVSNRDITERRKIEEELKESQERLTLAHRIAHLGNWEWNVVTNKLYWSDEIYRILGVEPLKFLATQDAFLELVHLDDRKSLMEAFNLALADPGYHYAVEHRIVRPDDSERMVYGKGEVIFNAAGRPMRMIGTIQDITERKSMEIKLARQLEEIKSLKKKLERENIYLRGEIRLHFEHEEIVGQSPGIKDVLRKIEQVAPTDSAVLILGETGTGKELVARAIHNLSKRKARLLKIINCASLPASLVECELFGREKGAYTGALTRQPGRFEVADGSTLLLDEIGELSWDLQSKLLRVIETGEFERLGSPNTMRVDVRLIASTNRDLAAEVRKGTFRQDLFYRLNIFPITVPPLRERPDDIPMLVWAFIDEFTRKMGKKIQNVPLKAMAALQSYHWPGNVRELRNVIEHAVIVSSGDTLEARLPETINENETGSLILTLEETDRRQIIKALQKTGWRIKGKQGAAELLGLKPSTLYTKMKKLKIFARHNKDGIPT